MRRTHLRGHANILKRLLVHVGGFNLGLLMRTLVGVGTPRGLQGRLGGSCWPSSSRCGRLRRHVATPGTPSADHGLSSRPITVSNCYLSVQKGPFNHGLLAAALRKNGSAALQHAAVETDHSFFRSPDRAADDRPRVAGEPAEQRERGEELNVALGSADQAERGEAVAYAISARQRSRSPDVPALRQGGSALAGIELVVSGPLIAPALPRSVYPAQGLRREGFVTRL